MRRAVVLGWVVLLMGCGASSAPPRSALSPWAERPDVPRVAVPVEGAPGRGAETPLVTMVVFSDFECPHCGRALPALEGILDAHPDDVRLHFRHLPLPFHEHAALAAEAATEALAQGGEPAFWQYHDALFDGGLREEELLSRAARLGLDAERLRIALRGRVHRSAVESDLALADRLGVDGTPTLFVNGRPLQGVPPGPELAAIVQEELDLAREALARGVDRASLYQAVLREARPTMHAGGVH